MTEFQVDRSTLPGPWDDPLIFTLRRGRENIVAQVDRGAAFEYSWPGTAPGTAAFLAPDRTDTFILDLEEAVNRLYDESPQQRYELNWDSLYPNGV